MKKFHFTAARVMVPTLLLSIALCIFYYMPHRVYAAENGTTEGASTQLNIAHNPLYNGLKRVALVVSIAPSSYDFALKCQEIDRLCAENKCGSNPYPGGRSKCSPWIREAANKYPAPLFRQALIDVFKTKLEEQLFPFMQTTTKKDLAVEIIETGMLGEFASKNQDTLLVAVRLLFEDEKNPRLAVLSVQFYRTAPRYMDADMSLFLPSSTAIPLNQSDELIQKELLKFVDSSIIAFSNKELEE